MFDPTREHQARHGKINHRLCNLLFAFVISVQTAIASQPAEGAFDNPATGQYNKSGWLVRAFYYFHDSAEFLLCPLNQFSGVAPIGPDVFDFAKERQCFSQKQTGAVAVLDVGGQDHHHQQHPHCVHQNVAFAPIDFLARVVTVMSTGFAGFDRLAVDNACGGLIPAVVQSTDVIAQVLVNLIEQSALAPSAKVAVNGLPRGQVFGQVTPGTPRFDHIKNGIEYLPIGVLSRAACFGCLWEAVVNDVPLFVGYIRCISHPYFIEYFSTRYNFNVKVM